MYGNELILDLYDCDPKTFSRTALAVFFEGACGIMDMKLADVCFWDYEEIEDKDRSQIPHLLGTSAVQFIETSNITIHALDLLKEVYLNIFSCKQFDPIKVENFAFGFFDCKGGYTRHWLTRGPNSKREV